MATWWASTVMFERLQVAAVIALCAIMVSSSHGRAQSQVARPAIDRGAAFLKTQQQPGGQWTYRSTIQGGHAMGATSLAALTLLECNVDRNDPAIRQAANYVRLAAIDSNRGDGGDQTYDIALAILFLDRLGSEKDVRLIESLVVRLLGGQGVSGGWTYACPTIQAGEAMRLRDNVMRTEDTPRKADKKPTLNDLPREIIAQLQQIQIAQPLGAIGTDGDNSNTQFATLALWVGRRHGLPVETALWRIEQRYRAGQNLDGGWSYSSGNSKSGGSASTPAMTGAGLLGLAVAYGYAYEKEERRTEKGLAPSKRRVPDAAADPAVRGGLAILSTAIGIAPAAVAPAGGLNLAPPQVGAGIAGRGAGEGSLASNFYYLWSLERVCMAYDLEKLGEKDWYAWGTNLILPQQAQDGSWTGNGYTGSGDKTIDSCLALLFLTRSNLAKDLTASLRGRVHDPFERRLRSKPSSAKVAGALADAAKAPDLGPQLKLPDAPSLLTLPAPISANTEVGRLSLRLVKAAETAEQEQALRELRDTKGVVYTEALAMAIPHLEGPRKLRAREALAERLTRMSAATLREKLKDDDPEVRRAAALAAAMNDDKTFIPDLVPLVTDPVSSVARAIPVALEKLTGQNLGPQADASPADRAAARVRWQEWWDKNGKK